MKKISALFAIALLIGFTAAAQCDKKVTYTSSKAEFLDASDSVSKMEESKIEVQFSKSEVTFKHNDREDDALHGDVKELVCEWKEAYKNGKTTFKTSLIEGTGDARDALVSIEGKDGKITILVKLMETNMKIRIVVENYKES